MIPAVFEYLRPASLDEAIGLLHRYGEDARLLAGGHSLIPLLKLRLAAPKYLVDIGRLRELAYIREDSGAIHIGALTTHAEIEYSDLLRQRLPLLPKVAAQIADVQVRNCGTIGGSLAHAHPAADFPAALLALDAEMLVRGPSGQRTVRASEFFVGLFTTALERDEVLVAIRFPALPNGTGSAYVKFEDKASHFALVGVAAVVGVDNAGVCRLVRLGVTGVGATPFRPSAVEAALVNGHLDRHAVESAAQHVTDGVQPLPDLFASSEYRAHLARLYTAKAVLQAANRPDPA